MAFNTDLHAYRPQLEEESYLHLENILTEEFVSALQSYGRQIAADELAEIEEWHIPGKKRQFLFDFPSRAFLDGFRKGLAELTGRPHDAITIGERHIKVYLQEAPDFSPPHMDRQAAEFTIGFPIHIPDESRVCFFPHMSRKENTEQRAAYAEMPADTDMEQFYDDDRIVKLKGDVGDMIIFHGSTIFHERIKPAGCLILYIKINAAGQDPLGEHASLLESLAHKDKELELA